MGRLTKQAIVAMALDMVGNPRIQTAAEAWLDLILDDLARTYRFPDLETQHQAAVASGVGVVAYPSNYGFLVKDRTSRAEGTFTPSDGSGSSLIYQASLGATRDSADHNSTALAVPSRVADDRIHLRWILHPIASDAGTVALNYQSIPAVVASTAVVWFPHDSAMVEAITFIAERRQRGGQINLAAAMKEATLRLARAAPSRLQLWRGGSGSGLDPELFR